MLEDSHLNPTTYKAKGAARNRNLKQSIGSATTRSNMRTNDPAFQSLDFDSPKKDSQNFSNLPAIADLLNIKSKNMESDLQKALIDLTKYAQNLEHVVRSKDKEIIRLEYINKYLTLAQQNKEQLLTKILEENRRLKDLTYGIERSANERKQDKNHSMSDPTAFPQTPKRGTKRQLSRGGSRVPMDTLKTLTLTASDNKTLSPLLNRTKAQYGRSSRADKSNNSILKMTQEEVNNFYAENENFALIDDLLKSEDVFIQEVTYYEREKMIKFYNAVLNLKEDHSILQDLVFKLKRIMQATITMTTSLMLDEAIERIVDETCECLDCDRGSTFIYDNTREELWSKVAKGSDQTIRVPVNKGIVGHVFSKGEPLNIPNAYADQRFNRAVDLKTGYKTNTILTVPIKDENRVIGVIQAVNKKGTGEIFSKDDEALLMILSNVAGTVLRNSMTYNEQLSFHNVLRSALKTGSSLYALHELNTLLPSAEKSLKNLMGVEKAHIVLKAPNANELFSIIDGAKKNYPFNCGIIGRVIHTGECENITNGYSHPLFNGIIDIETSMPLLCMPIKDPSGTKTIGAIQILNAKGIQGLSTLQRANVSSVDLETLEYFSKHLSQAIVNCYEWERLQAYSKGEPYYLDKYSRESILKGSVKSLANTEERLHKNKLAEHLQNVNQQITQENGSEDESGNTSDSNIEDS